METSKKTILTTLLALVIVVGALAVYAYVVRTQDTQKGLVSELQNSDDNNNFTDLQGNPFSFDSLKGTPLVVNSWASWTPFSAQELQDLHELAKEYSDRGVTIVAINRKEPFETVRSYLSSIGPTDALLFVQNPTDSFYTSVEGFAMPETLFYNSKGEIMFHKRGHMSPEDMRRHMSLIFE